MRRSFVLQGHGPEQGLQLGFREPVFLTAELAAHFHCARGFGSGPGFVLAEGLKHAFDPCARARAAEMQGLAAQRFRGPFVEQTVHQGFAVGAQQFGRGQRVEQGACPIPAVFVAGIAGGWLGERRQGTAT